MTYVDPGTFTAGTSLTSAEQNVIADDIRYLKTATDATSFDGVSLLLTSNVACANTAFTNVTWSSSPIDVSGWWTSGASITVPAGAIPSGYTSVILECNATGRFDTNSTGTRAIQFLQNGVVVEIPFSTGAINGDTTPVGVTVWIEAAAADVITIQVYQSSGGSLNLSHGNCHIKRIGVA